MDPVYRSEAIRGKPPVTACQDGALIPDPIEDEVQNMALEGHMQELSEKHKKLQELIEAEMTHPDWDEVRVSALKKEKLRIKDELERLRCNIH
jgi:hypothetical protein